MSDKKILISTCAGSSDVGELAYRVMRKLAKDGLGRTNCLAGVGAHVNGFVENAKTAEFTVAIDGCPTSCARKVLEHVGAKTQSFVITEMGYAKGKTEVTDEAVNDIAAKIADEINKQ